MSVRIEHIHLERLRGTAAALDVRDLAPDINVIHGPNGVGKSTLALALQEALWPGSTELDRPWLVARLNDDGTPWKVSIEAGYAVHDGPGGGRPDFGASDRRARYLIALHDLILPESETDSAFAARVLRESLGGYDLDAVAKDLGFEKSPKQPQKLQKELREAKRGVDEATARARELESKREALADLQAQRTAAARARDEAEVIQRVRVLVTARVELQNARDRLDTLPEAAGRLRGNEQEALHELREREASLQKRIGQAERRIADLDREITKHGLVGDAPDEVTRGHWKGLLNQVEETDRTLRVRRDERRTAEAALQEADVRLHGDSGAGSSPILSRDESRALVRLFSEWLNSDGQRAVLDQRARSLEEARSQLAADAAPGGAPSPETLKFALRQLEKWLREAPSGRRSRRGARWVLALAVLGLVTGAVAALFATPLFLLAALLAVALYALYRRETATADISRRDDIERTWDDIGIPAPGKWTEDDVAALHSDLTGQFILTERQAHAAHTLEAQARALREERQTWVERHDRLWSRLKDQCHELGWPIRVDDEAAQQEGMAALLWLTTLSEDLVARGEQQIALTKAAAAEHAAEEELERLLGSFSGLTHALGMDTAPTSAAAAREVWEAMETRVSDLAAMQGERDRTLGHIEDEWRPEFEEVQRQMQRLFVDAGLTPGDDTGLSRLLETRTEWLDAEKNLGIAEHEVARAEKSVSTMDMPEGMEEGVDTLLELHVEELASRMEMKKEKAATFDQLTRQIEETRARLNEAVGRQDVARAVAVREAAEEAVERVLAANERAMVGYEVARFVREVTVKDTLPQVFTRARDLLIDFTAGALELEVDLENTTPRFLARTHGILSARPVGELSVGERVHVLMAVRMAFLEQEETSPLPLILDETLGTTDDVRAHAVLRALLDLARRGRQLFYFTAQSDEVAKWYEALREFPGSVEDRIVDLAAVRAGTAQHAAPLPEIVDRVSQEAVPLPEGRDHHAYGKLLGVPGIRPHEETVDTVHIWHAMETAQDVYSLLNEHVHTAGQYRVLASNRHGITGTEADRKAVMMRIDVIEDAMGLWRQGRGRPLTRDVLDAAPGVSDRKLSDVWELARAKDGDAVELLAGLEAGEVSRFREDKREELRAWLEAEGYIPEVPPLTAPEAVTQLQVRHPGAETHFIERVVATIWA